MLVLLLFAYEGMAMDDYYYNGLTKPLDEDHDVTSYLSAIERVINSQEINRMIFMPIDTIRQSDVRSLPCVMPSDLMLLYKWHDGITSLIPGYDFLPLNEMVSEYQEIMELELTADYKFWPKNYLPVLRLDSAQYLAVDCEHENESPIYSVSMEDFSYQKRFYSVGHFVKIVSEAYQEGAYYVDEDFLEEESVLFRAIEIRHLSDEYKRRAEESFQRRAEKAMNLQNGSNNVLEKEYAIRDVAYTYDQRAVDIIKSYLDDKSEDVISTAAFYLGELKARDSIPKLKILLQHALPAVRNSATSSLAKLVNSNDVDLLPQLYILLHDEDVLVRMSAIDAIGRIASHSSVDRLHEIFKGEKLAVKYEIVVSLNRIDDVRSLDLLEEFLSEINKMDHDIPYRGGARGSDPHPSVLRSITEKTITKIRLHRN